MICEVAEDSYEHKIHLLMLSAADSALYEPSEVSAWSICRCRFESSTMSSSTMPIVPAGI